MLFLFLLLLSAPKSYPKFDISVPHVPQLGIHGQTVDLPCSFPVGSSWDLDTTVITWHRHLEIIHSFYHGQDQLDLQSSHYANRTSLYHAEMQKGSASLRLDRVTVRDEGEYTCSVSTEMGSQKRSLKLTIAELTQEPVFHTTSLSNIKVARLISLEEYSSPSLVDDATDITQVGISGQSVVLPCSFAVGSSFHLDTTEIIWEHNQEWIHIFYRGRDQPQHQSRHYTNRTSLYHEEIKNGNASLRLENATLRDEGEYTCTVIPWDEGQIKTLNLKIAAEFDISVPRVAQLGVYGQSVVLPCTFPVGSSWDLDTTVITWQRHLEVIHSFYHGQDQLDLQSAHYASRTSLYHAEMKKGNASLRLDRVTVRDEGEYTCSVSTQMGSQKRSFKLKIAASFPEPHLRITLLSNGQVDLVLTSQGGYPSPSLQWLMGDMEDVTSITQTELKQDQHTKLYSVNSKLNLTTVTNSSISFILRNEELGQEMRRNIDLSSESRGADRKDPVGVINAVCITVGVLLLLLVGISSAVLVSFLKQRRRNSSSETPQNSSGVRICQNGSCKTPLKDDVECGSETPFLKT